MNTWTQTTTSKPRLSAGRAWRVVALMAVLVGAALVVANWSTITGRLPGSDLAGNTLLTSSPVEIARARGQLGQLQVEDRPPFAEDYRRAAFGDAWTDTDGNAATSATTWSCETW